MLMTNVLCAALSVYFPLGPAYGGIKPATPFTVRPSRKASASATAWTMQASCVEPCARLSLVASRCPARQPMASWSLVLLQFMAWKICDAVMMLDTWKLPSDCGRYWIVNGPLVEQLPPYFERPLQSAEKNGSFEFESAM